MHKYFEDKVDSPFMMHVIPFKAEYADSFPAVTHVDYSARVQTVHRETNPEFHELLCKFYEHTKCPVLINTSFNVRGEPIVCSPEDAFRCFMGTALDMLVIGDYVLWKSEQDLSKFEHYEGKYELD